MKGTEKQVQYAEDILASGINTIKGNIERLERLLDETGFKPFETQLRIWKAILIPAEIKAAKAENAADVIEHRGQYDGRFWISCEERLQSMIENGKTTIEQIEKDMQNH